jgi:hypothetical protein
MAVALAPTKRAKGAIRCRRKFLRFFPKGFFDPKYIDWERGYKWEAHERWAETLSKDIHAALIAEGNFAEAARRAVTIEARTNLLFSFEKMALRDGVKSAGGAQMFAEGLYEFLYGRGSDRGRFDDWCEVIAALPRRQTRVLTWPIVTIFGFIALPDRHFFLKPMVTRTAGRAYGFEFDYRPKPNWGTYSNLLQFAGAVEEDLNDLSPRDMIDIQSFMWVQGSDEYDE